MMPGPIEAVLATEPAPEGHLDEVVPAVAKGERRRAWWSVVVGVLAVIVGLVIVGVGATSWTDVMVARFAAVIAGIFIIYRGIRRVVRVVAGDSADTLFGLALVWIVLLGAAAIAAPLLPLGEHVDSAKTLTEPSFARPDLFSAHPLGTNGLGLDILSRCIWGVRTSLTVSIAAVAAGTCVAGLIGLVAGYYRGTLDRGIGVLTNVGLAFPPLVLLLALAAVLRHNNVSLAIALAILVIPSTIRVARAVTLSYTERDFVQVSRIIGATRRRQIFRELMPSVALPLVSLAFVSLPLLIVAEASLSFLGLGVPPPNPSLGGMIAEGTNGVFEANPHVVLAPGIVLFLTVFALNIIGQRLRRHWDPREATTW
jgi:peptide/nickel transport system permease protein